MMMVLALGMSSPFSTIVVDSRMSNLPLDEAEHRALELVLAHLAVADGDPGLRHQPLQQRPDGEDRFHAVVHEVHLPAACQLVADRPLDDRCVEPDDGGLDRQPILGRRFDHRHVPDADERHVERAGNRRGRHRQDVHPLLQLLDPFLVRHAEPLLFVHDEQAQVAEADVLGEQPVRADQDVELAFSGGRQDAGRFLSSCGIG